MVHFEVEFGGFQISRTPSFRSKTAKVAKLLKSKIENSGFKSAQEEQDYKLIFEPDEPTKKLTKDLIAEIQEKKLSPPTEKSNFLTMLFTVGRDYQKEIEESNWSIFYSKSNFITCDNPVTLIKSKLIEKEFGANVPIQFRFIPLSAHVGLTIHNGKPNLKFETASEEFVKSMNQAIYHFAELFVFSADEDSLRNLKT